jgi:hypothetical protein
MPNFMKIRPALLELWIFFWYTSKLLFTLVVKIDHDTRVSTCVSVSFLQCVSFGQMYEIIIILNKNDSCLGIRTVLKT